MLIQPARFQHFFLGFPSTLSIRLFAAGLLARLAGATHNWRPSTHIHPGSDPFINLFFDSPNPACDGNLSLRFILSASFLLVPPLLASTRRDAPARAACFPDLSGALDNSDPADDDGPSVGNPASRQRFLASCCSADPAPSPDPATAAGHLATPTTVTQSFRPGAAPPDRGHGARRAVQSLPPGDRSPIHTAGGPPETVLCLVTAARAGRVCQQREL